VKYFLTGATGFIGGRVARQLVEAGHQVVAIARNPAKATELNKLGASVHGGDITDKESMRAPMTGVDGVFHIAGWYQIGVRDKTPGQKINVDGTCNVLTLMKELGIPKGVYTSTLTVYSDMHGKLVDESFRDNGPWLSEYDRTKWAAHYEVAVPMIQADLCWGHVDDIARVHLLAMEKGRSGESYNICGPHATLTMSSPSRRPSPASKPRACTPRPA
jgi:nucleoside-diphosphate-sugar epimerase